VQKYRVQLTRDASADCIPFVPEIVIMQPTNRLGPEQRRSTFHQI
jgi:hypothetical protein